MTTADQVRKIADGIRDLARTNPGRTPGHPWEEIAQGGREYLGIAAEAVIAAFITGEGDDR
jgi:hypothetical protein